MKLLPLKYPCSKRRRTGEPWVRCVFSTESPERSALNQLTRLDRKPRRQRWRSYRHEDVGRFGPDEEPLMYKPVGRVESAEPAGIGCRCYKHR